VVVLANFQNAIFQLLMGGIVSNFVKKVGLAFEKSQKKFEAN